MNPHCECPIAGFCQRHQMIKGVERHKRCRGETDKGLSYWNAWEQGRLGATAPPEPKLNPPEFGKQPKAKIAVSQIGTKLSEIIKREVGIEVPCETCREMIASLDQMTVEQAQTAKASIVANIVERAPEQAQTIWQRLQIAADSILHTGILRSKVEAWFDEALSTGAEPPPKKALSAFRSGRVAVAASRPFVPRDKPTAEQNRLFAESQKRRPEPKPFASKPVINLVYHIWPVRGTWHWHAERLRDLIPLCDGKVIIGIAVDGSTDDPDVVMDAIGRGPDYFVHQNIAGTGDLSVVGKPFGEVATAEYAFPKLRETGDSVTLYAHAKGIRSHTRSSQAVRLWTEMMYETVTFNHLEAIRKMSEGYDIVGSFRTFGFRPLVPKHQHHYSGTFWNVRTQSCFDDKGNLKPFQQRYGGTEAWPGDHIPAWNAHCVFEDNSPWLRQYDDRMMLNLIPKHLLWQSSQWEEVQMEQHHREFMWLLPRLNKTRSLLIIGSRHGGLEHHIQKHYQQMQITSVDIDPLPTNKQECMIRGSSHDVSIQQRIRERGPFDAVFIDGDHTYDGVKQDWEFARSLNPQQVFFHDYTDDEYHRLCGCEVNKLWQEIVLQGHATSSFAVGCGWGGISQVRF